VTWQLASIVPVWVLALVGAVLIAVITPGAEYLTWLPIALAASVIIAFAVQLAIRRKDGFVLRIMASVTGAVVVLGLATAILLPIA
jgi:hypothetical protein